MDPKLLASGSDDAKGTVKSKLFFYIFCMSLLENLNSVLPTTVIVPWNEVYFTHHCLSADFIIAWCTHDYQLDNFLVSYALN